MTKLLTGVTLALVVAACGDTTEPGEHPEPFGVEIRDGAEVLVDVFGEVVHGQITVAAGGETPGLSFVFITEEGDEITLDEDEYLEIDVTSNQDLIEVQYVNQNPGVARVHGIAAGTSILRVKLMHGQVGSGHQDFTSVDITVVVN